MNQLDATTDQTLEPPGTIVVIGGGPLGVEAALYGRYLGYNVTLLEAETIGHSFSNQHDQPLAMLPDRCLSPLALNALNAQDPDSPPLVLPTTVGQWVDQVMVALTQTDLLRDRVRVDARVSKIDHVEIERDADDGADDELPPPDFRMTVGEGQTIDAEAVIVATGQGESIATGFDTPCPYFFLIATDDAAIDGIGESESQLLQGFQKIVEIYACLADRESLDLYRPVRGGQEQADVEADEEADDVDSCFDQSE